MGYFYKMEGFQFYFLSGCAFEILNIMDSANIKLQKVGTSIREAENSTDYMRSLLNILKRKFAYKLFLVVQAPRTRSERNFSTMRILHFTGYHGAKAV